jgi:probable rRNA maturation factor
MAAPPPWPPNRAPKGVSMSASDDNIVLFRRAPAELDRCDLERFARVLRQQVTEGAGFGCLITTDRELRRLNHKFRGKDRPTDVLSFPDADGAFLGEIAISAQRAREQAAAYGHSIDQEICILMLHGVLHLMGMDHESDHGQMACAEADWRARLALPAGLIERVCQ